jgi:hypothetical protein
MSVLSKQLGRHTTDAEERAWKIQQAQEKNPAFREVVGRDMTEQEAMRYWNRPVEKIKRDLRTTREFQNRVAQITTGNSKFKDTEFVPFRTRNEMFQALTIENPTDDSTWHDSVAGDMVFSKTELTGIEYELIGRQNGGFLYQDKGNSPSGGVVNKVADVTGIDEFRSINDLVPNELKFDVTGLGQDRALFGKAGAEEGRKAIADRTGLNEDEVGSIQQILPEVALTAADIISLGGTTPLHMGYEGMKAGSNFASGEMSFGEALRTGLIDAGGAYLGGKLPGGTMGNVGRAGIAGTTTVMKGGDLKTALRNSVISYATSWATQKAGDVLAAKTTPTPTDSSVVVKNGTESDAGSPSDLSRMDSKMAGIFPQVPAGLYGPLKANVPAPAAPAKAPMDPNLKLGLYTVGIPTVATLAVGLLQYKANQDSIDAQIAALNEGSADGSLYTPTSSEDDSDSGGGGGGNESFYTPGSISGPVR